MDSQTRALEQFFRTSVQNLEAASKAVVSARAQQFKRDVQDDIKANFKRKVGGVSIKQLPPTGTLGPAAYVSVKPAFMTIFEEGGTIESKGKLMVILLPDGKRYKFPRVNKKGFDNIFRANQHRLRLVKSANGWVVLLKVSKKKEVPIYLLTTVVHEKKRLSFNSLAEAAGRGMAEEIASLINK